MTATEPKRPSPPAREAAGWRGIDTRMSVAVTLALACMIATALAGAAHAACSFVPAPGQVSAIGRDGNLALDDGTSARLADIAVALPDEALALITEEAAAILRLADAAPDRWGRIPVSLTTADDAPLARILVQRGLARVDPGPVAMLCDPDLLTIEDSARRARRGLWQDRANRPIAARDTIALLERLGEFVLVEGRIDSVGVRSRTTFIDLTGRWRGGFTVTVPAPLWQEVVVRMRDQHGLAPDDLTGRRIRVRGVMQEWRGPAIDLAIAAFIEILDDGP